MNVFRQFLHCMEVTLLALLLSCTELCESLLCSRCQSTEDPYQGRCENKPPTPSSCMKSSSDKDHMYCIKVEEYSPKGNNSPDEWILSRLHRDCTYLPSPQRPQECTVYKANGGKDKKICSYFCQTDGCNRANSQLHRSNRLVAISVLVFLLGRQINVYLL